MHAGYEIGSLVIQAIISITDSNIQVHTMHKHLHDIHAHDNIIMHSAYIASVLYIRGQL